MPEGGQDAPKSEKTGFDERVISVSGDLTEIEADAIVCPSLPDLDVLYTGVAGAIMKKGGSQIFSEARAIGKKAQESNPRSEYPVPLKSAHVTTAGDLPKAKNVIHSVSIDFKDGELTCDPLVVYESALNVLQVANDKGLTSVAFPALGSGLYGVPQEESFGSIAYASTRFLKENPDSSIQKILLVSRDPSIPKPTLSEELLNDTLIRSTRNRLN